MDTLFKDFLYTPSRMVKCTLWLLLFIFCLYIDSLGASPNVDKQVQELGKSAAKGYMGPFVTVFGLGMNSGSFQSSKPFALFDLPMGVSVGAINFSAVEITQEMRTFHFRGDIPLKVLAGDQLGLSPVNIDSLKNEVEQKYNLTIDPTVTVDIPNAPTVFGNDNAPTISARELLTHPDTGKTQMLKTIEQMNIVLKATHKDTINLDTLISLPFKGIDVLSFYPSVPKITFVEVGFSKVPYIDNINLALTYLPPIKIRNSDFGEVGIFGGKIQHCFNHLLVPKDFPLNFSGYFAFNNLTIHNGSLSIKQHNWISMVSTSIDYDLYHVLGVGIYGGVGVENSSLDLSSKANAQKNLPAFNFELKGENLLRSQIGMRLSLLMFDVWAELSQGNTKTVSLGVILVGLNGL